MQSFSQDSTKRHKMADCPCCMAQTQPRRFLEKKLGALIKYAQKFQDIFYLPYFRFQILLFRHLGKPPLGLEACWAISMAPKYNSNITCNYCNSIFYQLWKNCFRVYHWSPAMLGQLASALFWKIFFFRSMKQQAGTGKMPKSWFFEIHWTQGLAYPVERGYLKKPIFVDNKFDMPQFYYVPSYQSERFSSK